MTLYGYRCAVCGDFEEFRDNNDRKVCKCGEPVQKIYGLTFQLKGNGFYSTDKRRDEHLAETS